MSIQHTGSAITPLYSAEAIGNRVREMGREISRDYAESSLRSPLQLVVVLKGAFIFAADLARSITVPCTIDFIHASSYGSGKTSSGKVAIKHNLSVEGRHLLLVEDIIDTGLTMQQIKAELVALNPASLKICSLLDKPTARIHPVEIAYTGFVVPDTFLVGYGVDYDEKYRELPSIGVLNS
ncbi:MAG: hypoxanthine phosphoribosyltransferase [Chlorobium sp.]|nr:MAG: hypoxanthine phosphoribosyltransferase [Chlorobium sp.]